MFGTAAHATNAYRRLAVESAALGADRHQLIGLLFTGTLAAIGQARSAMARGDMPGKAEASSKAIRLISEGLMIAVDRSVGEMAEQLYQLWDYCSRRLLIAHLRQDDAIYEEVAALVGSISDAWTSISPQGNPTVRRAA
jgi:flagellar protein FliS